MKRKMSKELQIKWQNRIEPLEPSALMVFGKSAIELKRKLLSLDDEKLSSLQGVFAANMIFLAGKSENLPWINGIIYFGKDSLAPAIFLPTTLRPDVPVDLFEKALLKKFFSKIPFAVYENKIIPVGKMLSVSRRILNETFVES